MRTWIILFCLAITSAAYTQQQPLSVKTYVRNVTCHSLNGQPDGIIETVAKNGLPPYEYQWIGDNGFYSDQQSLNGLPAGTYRLRVTDSQNQILTEDYTLIEPEQMTLEIDSLVNDYCKLDIAEVYLKVEQGIAPYQILWTSATGGTFDQYFVYHLSSSDELAVLTGGDGGETYDIAITDATGCATGGVVTIESNIYDEPLSLDFDIVEATSDSLSDGSIDLEVEGGSPPYTYAWSGPQGFTAATEDLDNLPSGNYFVTVTDINDCTITSDYELFFQSSGITSNDNETTWDIEYYPNPATDVLNLTIKEAMELSLYNSTGYLVKSFSAQKGTHTLDLDELEAGLYFLEMTDGKKRSVERIVKL